jgi:cholinesterase
MSLQKFVEVETEYGSVKGVEKTSALGREYLSFQGIPYMKAPVGKLRFRDAQPPEEWTEVFDATNEPPSYVTFANFFDGSTKGQDDAGIINIYTHDVQPASLKPVLFWVTADGHAILSRCAITELSFRSTEVVSW